MHHVAVGAASKRQVESASEPNQISEGIVMAIMKYTAHVGDFDFRQLRGGCLKRQSDHAKHQENSLGTDVSF
jgi:hypothetical protein